MMMMMMRSHLLESSMSPRDFSVLTCHAFIIMLIVGLCSIMHLGKFTTICCFKIQQQIFVMTFYPQTLDPGRKLLLPSLLLKVSVSFSFWFAHLLSVQWSEKQRMKKILRTSVFVVDVKPYWTQILTSGQWSFGIFLQLHLFSFCLSTLNN